MNKLRLQYEKEKQRNLALIEKRAKAANCKLNSNALNKIDKNFENKFISKHKSKLGTIGSLFDFWYNFGTGPSSVLLSKVSPDIRWRGLTYEIKGCQER